MRLQAGLKAWTQVLMGQMEDKADVDMDTEAPQLSHKPGGEPKIKARRLHVVLRLSALMIRNVTLKRFLRPNRMSSTN